MSSLPILDTPRPARQHRAPRRHSLLITFAATVIGIVLIGAGLSVARGGIAGSASDSETGSDATTVADAAETTMTTTATTIGAVTIATTNGDNAASDLTDASAIGASVIPSVTTIQVSDTFRNREVVVGSGSGVIWSNDGYIVTNAHVVTAGESYEVVLYDGRIYPAQVVGIDKTTDLAVLHIDATGLAAITPGSTAGLLAGDPAIAIGSPLGLDGGPSLTVGVISAIGRTVEIDTSSVLYGMIQADAPITEGSSGGALVNENGELIGITSAVGVSTVGVEGIGFSTPVEIVARVVAEILATGDASQPVIGISGSTVFAATADGGEQPIGVQVDEIDFGSAAQDAGIAVGDVIAAIGGREISTMAELISEIRTHSAGETVELTLLIDDGSTIVSVTLGDS